MRMKLSLKPAVVIASIAFAVTTPEAAAHEPPLPQGPSESWAATTTMKANDVQEISAAGGASSESSGEEVDRPAGEHDDSGFPHPTGRHEARAQRPGGPTTGAALRREASQFGVIAVLAAMHREDSGTLSPWSRSSTSGLRPGRAKPNPVFDDVSDDSLVLALSSP